MTLKDKQMPLDPNRPSDANVAMRGKPDPTSPGRRKLNRGFIPSKLPYNPKEAGYNIDDVIAGVTPYIDDYIKYIEKRDRDLPDQIKDDLFSVGLEAAANAYHKYDGSSRFSTYAVKPINGAILRAYKYYKERGGPSASDTVLSRDLVNNEWEASLNIKNIDDVPEPITPEDRGSKQEQTAKILSSLLNNSGLNDTEKIVMQATYGIKSDGSGEYTNKGPQNTATIADAFGVSPVRISQVRKKAAEKIKKYVEDHKITMEEKYYSNLIMDNNDLLIKINYRIIWE